MCIALTLCYSGCGHQEAYIRSCHLDGTLCETVVPADEWQSGENFQAMAICRDCFMLPDPRASLIPDSGSESMIDWYAYRYPIWNVEAETNALQLRSQDLPLPHGPFYLSNFHSTNRVVFDPLSKASMEELDRVLNQHLLPDFWLRASRVERTSVASRIPCLRLRQIFLLNLALRHAESRLGRNQWCIAMGYSDQRLVPVTCALEEDCGICREPLGEASEQGTPVKTPCHHIFHRPCIETWLEDSARGDCPSCRRGIRSNAPSLDLLGTNPQWVRTLTAIEPLALPHETPTPTANQDPMQLQNLLDHVHLTAPTNNEGQMRLQNLLEQLRLTTPATSPAPTSLHSLTRDANEETMQLQRELEQARLERETTVELLHSINSNIRSVERTLFYSVDRDFRFMRLFRLDTAPEIISQQLAGFQVRHRRRQIFFAACDVERRRLMRSRLAAEQLINEIEERYYAISRELASARLASLESLALALQQGIGGLNHR
ncbi:hypothetical protein DSL72_005071 [Monilinia vaccinii-corymbosi]|uniref:RING-type domain-containing protein n=1 Tax=Monilinia vaccinii-corymbosi TaxID=61207 RepID=A0A8A3PEL4_9HELO|nr:hypothetical protein DSL72_005071 [Monilinia vaccinii-corymbosi]